MLFCSISDAIYRAGHVLAQRGHEMYEKEDSTFSIDEVRLVRSPYEHPL